MKIANKDKSKLKIEYIFNASIALIIFIILIIVGMNGPDKGKKGKPDYYTIDKSVVVRSSDGKIRNLDLPSSVEIQDWYEYSFYLKPIKREASVFVNVNTINLYYEISCDGEVLFTNSNNYDEIRKGGARSLELFKVPDEYLNRKLDIRFMPMIKGDFLLQIPPITWGNRSAILKRNFNEGKYDIYGAIFMISVSVLLFILVIVLATLRLPLANIVYIGTFSLLAGVYSIVRNWYIQLIVDNPNFMYYLDYTCLLLLPASIILIVANELEGSDVKKWKINVFHWLIIVLMINALSQLISTIFGGLEFIEMQTLTNISLVLSTVVLLLIIFSIDSFRYRRKIILIISILPLIVTVTSGILVFKLQNDIRINIFVILGFLFFLTLQFLLALIRYKDDYNESEKLKYYEKIAFTDGLTGLGTRHAFNRDIKYIKENADSIDSVLFMLIDLNALKLINDHYGHDVGDELLRSAGRIINNAADIYNTAKGYRFGGDEFILLIYNVGDDIGESIVKHLKRESDYFRLNNIKLPLSYAIGYEVVNPRDGFELEELIEKVDRKMYKDKSQDYMRQKLKDEFIELR